MSPNSWDTGTHTDADTDSNVLWRGERGELDVFHDKSPVAAQMFHILDFAQIRLSFKLNYCLQIEQQSLLFPQFF